MSVTDQNGWGEVERKAIAFEHGTRLIAKHKSQLHLVTITPEDRLRGAIVEALSQLEQGHQTAAWQILNDSLKIGGVQ